MHYVWSSKRFKELSSDMFWSSESLISIICSFRSRKVATDFCNVCFSKPQNILTHILQRWLLRTLFEISRKKSAQPKDKRLGYTKEENVLWDDCGIAHVPIMARSPLILRSRLLHTLTFGYRYRIRRWNWNYTGHGRYMRISSRI